MKTGDYFVESNLAQKFANTRGKISTQFMSRDQVRGNPSRKKALEDSVKMGGYEVSIRKPVKNRFDLQQPMTGHSEFWIG